MEARKEQDLFNNLADIIDFQPELFNQEQWGTQLTLERFKDSDGVEENVVHIYDEDAGEMDSFEIGGSLENMSACGTACCVAGWTVLLNGWHPTVTEFNNGEYSETYDATRIKQLYGKIKDYLSNAEHKIFELEYGFVADRPGVRNEGWNWTEAAEWENGVITLEDGVTEVGRVDIVAQKILGLSAAEASILFEASQPWVANDLRLMGKGEEIASLSKIKTVNAEDPLLQYGMDDAIDEIWFGEDM